MSLTTMRTPKPVLIVSISPLYQGMAGAYTVICLEGLHFFQGVHSPLDDITLAYLLTHRQVNLRISLSYKIYFVNEKYMFLLSYYKLIISWI